MRSALTRAGLAVLALVLAGCAGPDHMSPSYGRAEREALGSQAAYPAKPVAPPNMALDPQEASVVAESYVRSLSGKTAQAEPEPILIVDPQRQAGQRPLPPPSVPKN
jgi:hypothetical protein